MRDLTGQRFGQLVVIELAERHARRVFWRCLCDCGKAKNVESSNLHNGRTNSCGHLRSLGHPRRRPHPVAPTRLRGRIRPEYGVYRSAMNRCRNPRVTDFKYYGGRGIEFRFTSFEHFLTTLGPRPADNLSVDRINNDGHYEPGNVRWATPSQQARNKRRSAA